MTALHYQCLILRHHLQVFFNEPVLHPVLTYLSRLAVGDQLVGVECNVKSEVVVDHHLKSFSLHASSLVRLNGFCLQIPFGAVAVSIDPAPRFQFIQELRCQGVMQCRWNIPQCIF